MTRPCGHPDEELPTAGRPYDLKACRMCWLFVNDETYRDAWEDNGDKPKTFLRKVAPRRGGCNCKK